ncbi:MAG TPA: hypothetical protein DCS07_04450 [Bdellovibrionales bacterium]|nr:MAG: hypothetical protein A2Z97_04070 [Bdellovibrionales bacterium GWB1_52_6]OFZ04682.1 MAG: hypothetical protein A2X97_14050 [Bdellovibrionales bacterium GWA1_52_35]OFZ35844.1 MAG: hypothetical protein A2070_13840 [Bdellovibrionales bacterium GWC1_52_8]HAR41870.1 hypothetical protein [Bdellovibrionales bacterium]HCM39900.1 hypothetical protein [Bdellovibrionales bacterium]
MRNSRKWPGACCFLSLAFLFANFSSTIVAAELRPLNFSLHTGISGQKVYVASTLKDWDPLAFQMSEVSPGQYRIQMKHPWLHELQYKFVVDGQWQLDPSNPRKVPDQLGGFNSLLTMTEFKEDPLLDLQPGVSPPEMQILRIEDWAGRSREITIVEPARLHSVQNRNPVLIYFQDGTEYLEKASAANILANLSERDGLPRLIGVFVPPRDRIDEYSLTATTELYVDFFIHSMIPKVEKALALSPTAQERVLIGDSLGGLISLYLALRSPHLFQLVGSQSGAFLKANKVLKLLGSYQSPALRISLDIGIYENDRFLDGNERVSQLLNLKGWKYRYARHPAVHDWISWRNELPTIIRYLLTDANGE